MKNFTTLLLITALTATLSSCLKGNGDPRPDLAIIGDWALVNDSVTTTVWGISANQPTLGFNYVGVATDHYNFTAGGTLYVVEGNVKDTSAYALKQNSLQLTYSSQNGYKFNSPQTSGYTVTNLTAHTATLSGGLSLTPETTYTHIINLRK